MSLTTERCWNHETREAVALCPLCQHFFCRECVTEHEGRAICAVCLSKALSAVQDTSRRRVALQASQCVLGFVTAWFFFYVIGQSLLSIPSTFHEGAFWKAKLGEEP
jgi:hypothetical protein